MSGLKAVTLAGAGLIGYIALFALTSCSTVAGVGQDVQKVGDEIEEAAHSH
ncbi:entericidin A/B family lipoprotein [Haloferula rosea]|uniref:Entericidin A/B family lipoprotein n=1 Tax=Haloferula rosea TaxID=490093 RepID=A0A934VE69_9BACT|nr:entericidin A/B family lipoprotein [Haloferula rosea]MBK1825662.1 entericidin A/B family lipoprotein [Haloferula rosea]